HKILRIILIVYMDLKIKPGQSLTISCRVSGYSLTTSGYGTGWVRQREGKLMDWIFVVWYDGSSNQNEALKNKFSFSRDTSAGTVTITGQNLQPEDTAVYYCVRVNHSDTNKHKPVQKLSSYEDTQFTNRERQFNIYTHIDLKHTFFFLTEAESPTFLCIFVVLEVCVLKGAVKIGEKVLTGHLLIAHRDAPSPSHQQPYMSMVLLKLVGRAHQLFAGSDVQALPHQGSYMSKVQIKSRGGTNPCSGHRRGATGR
uniref:Ig-like domain-containing protein n=1 Tax=Oryzias melastigma TaxID=30732 RepID=A0A3B3DRB7_ORYME